MPRPDPLSHVRSMIILFAMPGCPACHEYEPRFRAELQRWIDHGVPMREYVSGGIPHGVIPVLIINATSADPAIQALADQHDIQGMPTTLLLTWNAPPVKLEGSVDNGQIYQAFASAAMAAGY